MKYLLLKTLILVMLSFSNATQAASVNLNLASPAIKGSSFKVEVWSNDLFDGLSPTESLLSFGFNIVNNNPSLFTLQNVDITSPFTNESLLAGIDAHGVSEDFFGISNQPSTQSVLLASLTFMANEVGSGSIGINSDLTDLLQGFSYFEAGQVSINGDLNIKVAAVPLPASLPLLISGLGMLSLACRKR